MHPARVPLSSSERHPSITESVVSLSTVTALPITLLLGLIGVLGGPTIGGLLELWSGRDDYSHGYLVPIISAYLMWNSRDALFRLPLSPSRWMGMAALALSGAVLVLAQMGGMVTVGGVALVSAMLGAVLLVAGVEWTRHLLLPLGYLLLGVPVLDSIIAPLHWPFQLLTAEMSTKALQAVGVPAFLEGNYITIPEVTMEVATQCSGASLLVAVVAIGIPLAYVNLRLWSTRAGLLVFGIAVAIVANWARVTVIGLYAHLGGKEFHGPMHIFQGLSVAWIGFVALFIGAWVLGRFEERRGVAMGLPQSPAWSAYRLSPARWARVGQGGWMGVGVVAMLAVVMYGLTPVPTPLRQELSAFPYEVGGWRGAPVGHEAVFLGAEGADAELVREYVSSPSGLRLQLYVAYFSVQGQGKETVNDRTSHLHQQADRVMLDEARGFAVNIGRVDLKEDSRLVAFWYEDNGRVNTDRRWAKVSTILNGALRRKTNGALVVISTPRPSQSGEDTVRRELESFAALAHPLLREYLP